MKNLLVSLIFLLPFIASAQGSKIEMVDGSVNTVLKKFSDEENKTIVDAFNGVKAWVSGSQVKVKVYYNANANTIDYVCEMMDHSGGGEEMLMCSK